jgi:tetratricopeptide (TPR) repeat protein/2-polyprenyl-3-methyl-5-hydroxy-6-metoxy-1,4-benzoquinol methylase
MVARCLDNMELTIEQALQQAVEAHKAGKLQDAEALYRVILQAQPKQPDANHNLGVLAVSLNRTEAALPLFKIALEANPSQGQFWLSYVDALIKEKQFGNARNLLEQGKKQGLTGEKVDLLDAKLAQLANNLTSQKTEPNKLSKAIELREMGRYKEAQDWLTKFLEAEPNNAEGWSLLSQLFLLHKKDAQAEKAIATAININPNLSSIYRNQARLLLKNSKPAEALLKAQSGFEKSTEDPESLIVLAACLGANQRDLEAVPLIERALKARPNYAEAFANRALVRLRAKNTSGAIEDLEKAGVLKPHLTHIWELLGTLRYQNKDLSGAIEALKNAQALEPDNVIRMINLGELLRQDKRIEESIAILEEATDKAPENASAWINLGTALQQDNKIENAQVAYKKALVIHPNSAEVFNNLGSIAKDTKDWESARKYFEQAIAIKPDYAEGHSNLGNTLQELGRLEDAETSYNKAIAIKPDFAEAHINLGNTLKKLGRLEDAETSYKKTIEIKPDFAEAHYNLGITQQELGRLKDAETSYERAIAIKSDFAEAHSNLGNTLKELGRLEDAETSYDKAIAIKSDYAQAHYNLGITQQELGRLEDAETSYKKAIAIKPDYAEGHSNLGNTLKELGRLEDAVTSYKKTIEINPDFAEAHSNLGITLQELGRLEDAETSYKKAIAIKPDFAEAHSNLSNTLKELGRLEDAINSVIKSIRIKPTVVAKNLFIAISKKLNIKTWDLSLSQLVIAALIEPWGRPADVMPFALRLLRKEKEFAKILNQSSHEINEAKSNGSLLSLISDKEFDASALVQAMLTSTPIPDSKLETVFTTLRTRLLKVASSILLKDGKCDEVASLYCWIAQQCFINEYVYFQTTDEIHSSQSLRDLLKKALEEDQSIPSAWVIAVACYFPLYSIAGAEKLLRKNYSSDIHSVLVQQIQEPLEELDLRKSILSLTSIENQVSLKVQSQYEENPYPRWTRLPKDSSKKYLNLFIQSKFPSAGFQRLGEDRDLEILIAGCGTGQHSVGTSLVIKGANILAVDLSMASLSYAKRKTAELGIDSIEYAQADLLKLNSLDRTFHVIESSGVLHHLENPFDGWEVLLSLLRPHGLMRLGFYSEIARRDIVRVRNLISSAGIGSSSQDIRGYRKHLLGLKNFENYGFATSSLDFFSTSACRDLLFHVQEHRMNLHTIDRFLKDHDLNFLGFEIDSSVIQAYKKRFSNDTSATNLDQWHIYEEENPDTFIAMYQFYVQKKS